MRTAIFSLFVILSLGLNSSSAHFSSAFQDKDDQPTEQKDDAPQEQAEPDDKEEEKEDDKEEAADIDPANLAALKFRSIGPALMSGRIADIAIDPKNPNLWYVAVGSGGVWKTNNAGTTWDPIFDKYASYSIGCVTIDPNNNNHIWVGTGENVAGRHAGFGDGVYFSSNAGKSFKNMWLKKSEHISKIAIHPEDSQTIFVASQGPMWSMGGERGLYKSTDAGATWKNVLAGGDYTGVTDVVINPDNPEIMFAATYQKHRTVWALMAGGPESGVHRSTDGGETWSEVGGIPGGDKGKISLAISPQNSEVVYATVELPQRTGGFFRSEDGGVNFKKMSDYVGGGTGPHYYQEIWCDPHRFDSIYHANVVMGRSDDGGKNFEGIGNRTKHVDNHALAFHPTDPNTIVVGCDGGVYVSHDRGETYRFVSNLPLTQFYKLALDNDYPFYNVVGGTQDNNTQYGPAATNRRQGITNRDWRVVIGGDGHDCAIDPTDPNIIYGESQQGYLRRYDRRTGETVSIRPQPGKGETDLRFNWDSPIEISFHDNKRLYFGSRMLHRSDDRGDSWTAISPDLSRNQNRLQLEIMGRFWGIDDSWDLFAMSAYNNITSIGESPLDENLIYVGTDDGLIQVTEDGGENWRKIDLISGLPEMAFVNDIKACRHDADTVFVCCDNHKYGDYKPYILKSTDRGETWEHIAQGLPENHLCWRIIQDHEKPGLLFLGTEFGVFASLNGGDKWFKFSNGLPTISFRDLEIQRRENDLVGATFGRGFYVLDDYSPLREATAELFEENDFHLFAIKEVKQFPQADFLGGPRGSQGNGFYIADNPAYGAVFTWFSKMEYKKASAKRKEAEKAAAKAGEAVPFPTIDDLNKESQDSAPQLVFSIQDSSGNLIQTVKNDLSKGMHRVSWNLRNFENVQVPAGQYSVSVDKVHHGEVTSLSEAMEFAVVRCIEPTLEVADRSEVIEYFKEVGEFQDTLRDATTRFSSAKDDLEKVESAIQGADEPHYELVKQHRELLLEWNQLNGVLTGDNSLKQKVGSPSSPTIQQMLRNAFGPIRSLNAPTQTHKNSFEIAKEMYIEVQPQLAEFVEKVDDFVESAREAGIHGLPKSEIQPIER